MRFEFIWNFNNVGINYIRVPEINGIELPKTIRETGSQPMIIMLTIYAYKQYSERCPAEGADFFLDKSQDIEELTETIVWKANETKRE